MIKAIIIEQEKNCVQHLRQLIKTSGVEMQVMADFPSVEAANVLLHRPELEVAFIDFKMNDKAFNKLRRISNASFEIIFTSACPEHAIRAIKCCAFDYLLKPISKTDFDLSVKRLKEKISQKNRASFLESLILNFQKRDIYKKISIPTLEGLTFIEIRDIIRCRADINYTHIYLRGNKKLTVSKSLRYFEDILGEFNFCRIHNSHLINLAYLKAYTKGKGGYVTLIDNSEISVSTRKRESFLKQLQH